MKLLLFIICLLVSFPNICLSQFDNLQFKELNTNDGLSSNSITDVLQDSFGFIWIGTNSGLNKYDGYGFTIYKTIPDDTSSLSENYIREIFEDSKGNIWIATRGGGLNMFDRGNNKFIRYENEKTNLLTRASNDVLTVCEDGFGRIWYGAAYGLYRINSYRNTSSYFHSPEDLNSISDNTVTSLVSDGKKGLWIGTYDGTLNYLNFKTQTVYNIELRNGNTDQNNIIKLYKLNPDTILVNVKGALKLLSLDTKKLDDFHLQDEMGNEYINSSITSIEVTDTNFCIVTATSGMFFYNLKSKNWKRVYAELKNYKFHNNIDCTLNDRDKNLWIGTHGFGVYRADLNRQPFNIIYPPQNNKTEILEVIVNSIQEDTEGNIWFSTPSKVIFYNSVVKEYSVIPIENLNSEIIGLEANSSKNSIYACTTEDGIIITTLKDKNFRSFELMKDHYPQIVRSFFIDNEKNFWIGSFWSGLLYVDKDLNIKSFKASHDQRADALVGNTISVIFEDSEGNIWLGTPGHGLSKYNVIDRSFTNFLTEHDKYKLSNGNITSIQEDSYGNIWVGTTKGLNLINTTNNSVRHFYESDGLLNDQIKSIVEDNNFNLWISTGEGITKINLSQFYKNDSFLKNFRLYNISFTPNSYLKSSTGKIYFGCNRGLLEFDPGQINTTDDFPNLWITSFEIINNNTSTIEEIFSISKESYLQPIELSYDENDLSFEYVALDYDENRQIQYAYMLENYDDDWRYVGELRKAIYTNLSPGQYTFKVMNSDKNGVWNPKPKSISVTIYPPIWNTIWAHILYLITFLLLLYLLRNYYLNRLNLKHTLELEKQKSENLKELDLMKTNFFENIAHEIRTPLTLIISPLESIKTGRNKDGLSPKFFKSIRENALHILRLVNQILDLSKIKSGNISLDIEREDIVALTRVTAAKFSSLAEGKSIDLTFNSTLNQLIFLFDKDKIERVLYNLLSNALKFTEKYGSVDIGVSVVDKTELKVAWSFDGQNFKKVLKISVKDTGIGIKRDELAKVFKRFYQVKDYNYRNIGGSGIGLTISNEYVKLHKGEILLKSEIGVGTEAVILIPLQEPIVVKFDKKVSDGERLNKIPSSEFSNKFINSEGKIPSEETFIILIIEDNEDVLQLIHNTISEDNFHIVKSRDGEEGINKISEVIPDLIITDLMMPKLDGIELCKQIKNDDRYNHIPVILLTARAEDALKLKGYEFGAIDYIIKPFNPTELKLKISNIIETRYKLKKRINAETIFKLEEVNFTPDDEKFMKSVFSIIEKNLSNPDLSVELLISEFPMSRTIFYKKIKSLTGKTPNEIIKLVRLGKAKILLEKNYGSVTEIAFEVGFNNPSYFSECFIKEFGQPPSKFIHNNNF